MPYGIVRPGSNAWLVYGTWDNLDDAQSAHELMAQFEPEKYIGTKVSLLSLGEKITPEEFAKLTNGHLH